MKKPKISIIIPVYKVEGYLNRCLDSVVNQTFKDIEIILVDDGSPDDCPQLCDDWAMKDSRIKVVHKKNEGLGLARNTGMLYATGEFIAFVDSDDFVDINMYEILYNKAVLHGADIVYCGYKYGLKDNTYEDKNDFVHETIYDKKEELENLSINYFYPIKGQFMMMSVWHSIYKKTVIKTLFHSEREVVSEDLHFQLSAILNSNKVVYIPDSLYYYCYNGESLSHTFKFSKFFGFQKLLNLLLSLYPGKERYAYKFYYNTTLSIIRQIMCNHALSCKEKIKYLKEIYSDPIWEKVKIGTDITMYSKHHKFCYLVLGKKIFCLFFLIVLFDHYIVCKNLFR